MRESQLRRIINEEISNILKENNGFEGNIKDIKSILFKYIDIDDFKILVDNDTTINITHKWLDLTIQLLINNDIYNDKYNIYIYCNSKIELSSTSLSDPKKAYRTTSARSVKHKNLKLRKYVDTITQLDIELKKFFTKIGI